MIKRTWPDRLSDRLAWAGLLFLLLYTFITYRSLPDVIPIHFNWKGEADRLASKATIWILPGILAIIFTGLSVLTKYPQIFNYPSKITSENAERQYTLATRLIRFLKLTLVIIFTFINIKTVSAAHNQGAGMGVWFAPVFILILCLPTVIYFYVAMKNDATDDLNKR